MPNLYKFLTLIFLITLEFDTKTGPGCSKMQIHPTYEEILDVRSRCVTSNTQQNQRSQSSIRDAQIVPTNSVIPNRETISIPKKNKLASKLPYELVRHICSFIPPDQNTGWTKLQDAAQQCNLNDIKTLIKLGFDVNEINDTSYYRSRQNTPLYLVTKKPDIPGENHINKERNLIIGMLLNFGADPNKPSSQGWLPIHLAIFNRNVPALKKLIQAGTNLSRTRGFLANTLDYAYASLNTSKNASEREKSYEICRILERAGVTRNIPLNQKEYSEMLARQAIST